MRVLHVYRTYFPDPPGGLQEAIRQICLSTRPYGIDNTLFALSPHPDPAVLDFPEATVVRCRSWAAPASCDLGGPQALSTFRRLAQEADVIHYFFPWPFADILRLAAPQVPSVLTYISDIVRQRWLGTLYTPLMWHTLNSVDAIVVNAPSYAQHSPVLSTPSLTHKIRQIPLGIVSESYDIQPDPHILARHGISDTAPFLLFIGVLRYYKGLHILVEAARKVQGTLVIAGAGPEEDALHHQVRASRLTNVLFTGRITDAEKTALLMACRGLVLPSHLRSEAYGMVLVEASLYAKPMVTCEIGTGTSFINLHGETGFVVPPNHPDELATAMNRLLSDPTCAQRMGEAARQRYERLFSATLMGQSYAALFRDIFTKSQSDSA